ncbi:MAG TPA: DUF2249 domain-containing protein [Gemmatimonadaceae bacterium]|nr:DUF2249 domain-containing protein [Gemmatimonadaceae bacterium]
MSVTQETVPVRRSDVVSDVLIRDESLVDVFVEHAPALSKLRNRAMRRVMARLVTVEQAARLAGVSPDLLVRELNRALGVQAEEPDAQLSCADAPLAAPHSARPSRPRDARVVEVDVRDDLRAGREPFSTIMHAVAALDASDVLRLRATFEPVPLCTVLGKRGFTCETEEHGPDDWSAWFWRAGEPAASASATPSPGGTPEAPRMVASAHTASDEQRLDVRGLEPPEPMMRTLAALEHLPPDHTLVHVNVRVPQFLLPILRERGYTYTIDEARADEVLVRIRRTL